MIDDPEYLYTPINGPAKTERKIFKNLFEENDTYLFMPTRKTELDGFVNVIITEKNDSNLFTSSHMDEIIQFNGQLKNTEFENGTLNYEDVCGSWKGSCLENTIFNILKGSGKTIDEIPVTYPKHGNKYFLASQLGGVDVNERSEITRAKAVMLVYFVRYTTPSDRDMSDRWLAGVKKHLLEYNGDLIKVNFQTSLSINEELARSTEGIFPRMVVTYSILFGFCAISCTMMDWVC